MAVEKVKMKVASMVDERAALMEVMKVAKMAAL
jgi:hypothetical protein